MFECILNCFIGNLNTYFQDRNGNSIWSDGYHEHLMPYLFDNHIVDYLLRRNHFCSNEDPSLMSPGYHTIFLHIVLCEWQLPNKTNGRSNWFISSCSYRPHQRWFGRYGLYRVKSRAIFTLKAIACSLVLMWMVSTLIVFLIIIITSSWALPPSLGVTVRLWEVNPLSRNVSHGFWCSSWNARI